MKEFMDQLDKQNDYIQKQQEYIDKRINQRDKDLLKGIRELQKQKQLAAAQEKEEEKKKGLFQRILKNYIKVIIYQIVNNTIDVDA